MKTLVNGTSTMAIIKSTAYAKGDKDNGYTYHRRVDNITMYVDDLNADGHPNGKASVIWLSPATILEIAKQITNITEMPAHKTDVEADDDLPF